MRLLLVLPSAAFLFAQALPAQGPAKGTASGKIELKDTPSASDEPLTPDVKLDPGPVPTIPGAGNAPVPQDIPIEDEKEIPFGLEKLSQNDRREVRKIVSTISTYLGTPRQLEAWEKIDELEKITGPYHMVENLRGAVLTKMKNLEKARVHFVKAADLAKTSLKDSYHPHFNIAELDFVERKWDAARAGFMQVLAEHLTLNEKIYADAKAYLEVRDEIFKALDERDAAAKAAGSSKDIMNNPAVKAALAKIAELRKKSNELEPGWKFQYRPLRANERLIHFKLMICDLQQGKVQDAAKHQETFDKYDVDSPAYYFAEATQIYIQSDKLPDGAEKDKLKEDAQAWLDAARSYPDAANQIYLDALIEMGWIQSLGT